MADRPRYVSERRNGYGAIDLYRGDICVRTIEAGIPAKRADIMAGYLNEAVHLGEEFAKEEMAERLSNLVNNPYRRESE